MNIKQFMEWIKKKKSKKVKSHNSDLYTHLHSDLRKFSINI